MFSFLLISYKIHIYAKHRAKKTQFNISHDLMTPKIGREKVYGSMCREHRVKEFMFSIIKKCIGKT